MVSLRLSCVVLVLVAAIGVHADMENAGVRAVLRVYDECSKAQSFAACLKKKSLIFVDRLARMDKISVAEGLSVVRATAAVATSQPPVTDDELERNLPRALEARDAALSTMLLDKISSYVSSRTLQITLPKITGKEISRSLEEGRGKMKKMMGMMMMGMAAKMAGLIPIAIGALFLMAGKALIISKIALLLAVIIVLKKIIASFLDYEDDDEAGRGKGGKHKIRKKYRKYMLPLLIAYKLKFFTLIPVLIGGLLLLTGATGLAGFFFALFAASMGLTKSQ
ncbi:Osiris 12 [Carabus blaptoides fortunei]